MRSSRLMVGGFPVGFQTTLGVKRVALGRFITTTTTLSFVPSAMFGLREFVETATAHIAGDALTLPCRLRE